MIKFEIVKGFEDKFINLPKRGTKYSAGYDIEAAETIIVPSLFKIMNKFMSANFVYHNIDFTEKIVTFDQTECDEYKSINEIKKIIKEYHLRTMVPTGIKVKMENDMFLELHPRSSTGCNALLQLANQTGIVDADYYNNKDNEGHIFVSLVNLSPFDIKIKKGDKIAQAIFRRYELTDDDIANELREGGFGSTTEVNHNGLASAT